MSWPGRTLVWLVGNVSAESASPCAFICDHNLIHTVLICGWNQETLPTKHLEERADFVKANWTLVALLITGIIEMNEPA